MDPALLIIISLLSFALALLAFLYSLNSYRAYKDNCHIHPRKAGHNPIISPLSYREWEDRGTFNPTAITDDEGKVHLLYRAIGNDGISRIGYASSQDGLHIDGRSPYPVFAMSVPERELPLGARRYDPVMYSSGGSWGGTEDPRAVRIGNRVYMTMTAFEDWGNMRIAMTSIALEDMKKHQWKWRRPVFISAKNSRSKNWVIFPEKVNGRYAIIHGISPHISITYTDSLDMIPEIASSPDHGGRGYHDPSRDGYWDNWVRGAGAPPIKTSIGWLLLYHALDQHDPGKYKVGAMILDRNDPTKVIYRGVEPILFPDMPYEHDNKPNIVYASGAVIKGDNLYIYYGGGDKHVCVAETNLDELLKWLMDYGKV